MKRLLLCALLLLMLTLSASADELTVDAKTQKDVGQLLTLISQQQPTAVELGQTPLKLADLLQVQSALPDGASLHFEVKLCRSWFDSDLAEVDLDTGFGHVTAEDLEAIIALFPNVTSILTYTHKEVGNDVMIPLMEQYPAIHFGWLLHLGKKDAYLIRTDATAFSTLKGHAAPWYVSEDFALLKYVPNLKALDLGHNHIDDLSFLLNFPDLRILILADNCISDLTPLASLPNLEYLELFMNNITDVTPLASLTKLTDLNMCHNACLDLSPLDNLPLARFFCSYNGVSDAEIARFESVHPDCMVNWLVYSSTSGLWREDPKYEQFFWMFRKREYHPFE